MFLYMSGNPPEYGTEFFEKRLKPIVEQIEKEMEFEQDALKKDEKSVNTLENVMQEFAEYRHDLEQIMALNLQDGMDLSDILQKWQNADLEHDVSELLNVIQEIHSALQSSYSNLEKKDEEIKKVLEQDRNIEEHLKKLDGYVKQLDKMAEQAEKIENKENMNF